MLTFKSFSGINNVLPSHRLTKDALVTARNVDIGLDGELRRRSGYTAVLNTCHKSLWQAKGFMLATVDGNDLVAIAANGGRTTASASIGVDRVWYCNLPDGRTAFSNGLINGLTGGGVATKWGVPTPSGVGSPTGVAGGLFPGDYRYQTTHVRLSDGLEGGPAFAAGVVTLASGGIVLAGLPILAGHKTNVYLTSHNGDRAMLAGSTTNSAFSFTGVNGALVTPCQTEFLEPAPAGRCLAFWRGRALVAVGPVLYASLSNRWEHFDFRQDFKQFSADITLVQPVTNGIFVGTTTELAFLAGTDFGGLVYSQKIAASTVLGSGVAVRGELIRRGDGPGAGEAMVCIADRVIVAGFDDGGVSRLTQGRYTTTVNEVAATFRKVGEIPQYIAVPQ